jgi:hypothetical protein
MTGRLQELAAVCETRRLTAEELNEAFDLSVGAETVQELEQLLAETSREEQ